MTSKVFCGNLPWTAGDQELASAMASFGEVTDAKVITDKETGRSRGFGFVTFASEDAANAALKAQSVDIGGRSVRIDAANDGGGGGGRRGGGGNSGGRPAPRVEERRGRPGRQGGGEEDDRRGRRRDRY